MALNDRMEANASVKVMRPSKEALDALQLEVSRLREEKRLAGEIFSETICSYEEEVRHLKEAVAAAQQQLKAAETAAAAAAADPCLAMQESPSVAEEDGACVGGDILSPRQSERQQQQQQQQQEETAETPDAAGSHQGLKKCLLRQRQVSLPETPEAGGLLPKGAPSFFSRVQPSTVLDGRSTERENVRAGTATSLPRISGPRSWKALLFSKERFGSGKVAGASDYSQGFGVSPWRSFRGRGRGLGCLQRDTQGASSSAVWIDNILPDWEAQKETPAFELVLQRGIPHDVRGEVWKKAIGDQLRLSPQYYELLVARMHNARNHLLETSSKYRERIEEIGGPLVSCVPAAAKTAAGNKLQQGDTEQQHPNWASCSVCGAPTADGRPAAAAATRRSSDSSSSDSRSSSSCSSKCCFMWEEDIFSSFLAISADLHRTLPRLGLVNTRSNDSSKVEETPAAAAPPPTPAAAAANHDEETAPGATDQDAAASPAATATTAAAAAAAAAAADTFDATSGDSSGAIGGDPEGVSEGPLPPASDDSPGAPGPAGPSPSGARRRGGSGPGGPPDSQAVAPVPFGVAGGEKMETFLQTVLEAYVMLRPDLGYVQGMAFLAATLLLYMDEYSAFVCFSNLMLRRSLHAFYTFDMPLVELYFRTFDALLGERHPLLLQHFEEIGVETDIFLVDWMYTLFTRCLPFELLGRVWDLFVIKGDVVLFQTSLAIVSYFREELQEGSLDDCMAILSPSTTTRFQAIRTDRFLDLLFGIRISPQRLEALMTQVQKDLNERRKKGRGPHGSFPLLRRFDSEVSPAAAAAPAAASGEKTLHVPQAEGEQGGDSNSKGHQRDTSVGMRRRSFTWSVEETSHV